MKISVALNTSQKEMSAVSDMVASFSQANYVKDIQKVIRSIPQKESKIKLDIPTASLRRAAVA